MANGSTELYIGTGGWAYFKVPGCDPLEAYARAFNFVEVNSTFYEIPRISRVTSWLKRVPPSFKFTVRCHRSITHKYRFRPVEQLYENFERVIRICRILRADFLHIQTPPSFAPTKQNVERIRSLLSSVELRGMNLALEVRWVGDKALLKNLVRLLEDQDITHCVDISREDPFMESDVLYTRLFGKGAHNVYQFTDEELEEIDRKVTSGKYKRAYVTFHGVKMYKDAARFKTYKQTGKFPKVTGSVGLQSLREVLAEDGKFPCTKQELIQHQGWKLIDITRQKRVRASELLKKLPEGVFHDIDQVIQELSVLES